MPVLRWVLIAQLAFFAGWGGLLLTSHQGASTVWLETEPVDPRDLLSGHYVALRYQLANDANRLCAAVRPPPDPGPVYLRLAPSGAVVMTSEGAVPVSHATECRAEAPVGSNDTWISGRRIAGPGFQQISFGIERFYVPETSPLRRARSGEVVAEVAVNDAHQARIQDLVDRLPPTGG